jgi:DNA-binding PadR family transcriptional regulator
MTGYELATRMRTPIGYFWTAGHSQIYPELQRLTESGLVSSQVVDGPGPRPTRRYTITAHGVQAVREWVTSPIEPEPGRSQFLLRVYCLWLVDPQAARGLVCDYRSQHLTRLAEYERKHAESLPEPPPGSPTFASYATLRAGLGYERHVVSYCDWLIGALDG